LSLEATSFLDKRGSFEAMEKFSIIRLYFSHEKPSYLPYYVLDKIFVVDIYREYKSLAHFFNEKRKRQFIPLPWKIGEITVKIITHIDEISIQFDQCNLNKANEFEGFNPSQLFMKHMISVGYNVSFFNTFMFGEEEGERKKHQGLTIEE
jgi:hypothetical protein